MPPGPSRLLRWISRMPTRLMPRSSISYCGATVRELFRCRRLGTRPSQTANKGRNMGHAPPLGPQFTFRFARNPSRIDAKRGDHLPYDGITANAVLPGLTNTMATAPQSEEQKRATWKQQAIKRLGEPESITGT